jgi:hypothetical protein
MIGLQDAANAAQMDRLSVTGAYPGRPERPRSRDAMYPSCIRIALLTLMVVLVAVACAITRAAPATLVEYQVAISGARPGLVHVSLHITAAELRHRSIVTLRFRDLARQPGGLAFIHASQEDHDPMIARDAGDSSLVCIAADARFCDLTVDYEIDPRYHPPGSVGTRPAEARSRIGDDVAVLRSTAVFPGIDLPSSPTSVRFILPEDWVVVARGLAYGEHGSSMKPRSTGLTISALGDFEPRR